MQGTGVPLVTPFDDDGEIAAEALRSVVSWLESSDGIDFLVPCGSTSEAPLMDTDERARVIEVVADETDLPVLAGTGHAGYRTTVRQTERAAEAGADAALVVTPHYYGHDAAALSSYYRDVADASPVPVYLYSVPKFTGVALQPETVAGLATHDNVVGIKDSSGDVARVGRHARATRDEEFDVLNGSGSVYAHALDAGATGGVLALANVVPDLAGEIRQRHRDGDEDGARRLNAELVDLNVALTGRYGVPGVKAAVAHRDVPAGSPRRPLSPVGPEVRRELAALVDAALS
jgi:4-hydroxy-tetrahydrodipicolinate synthase/4-hydroxy-2-oxoglutarate aldolase